MYTEIVEIIMAIQIIIYVLVLSTAILDILIRICKYYFFLINKNIRYLNSKEIHDCCS